MWLLLLLVLGVGTTARAYVQPQCNATQVITNTSSSTTVTPNNVDVIFFQNGTVNVTLVVDVSSEPIQPVDVYFLWEDSFDCRTMSSPFWQTDFTGHRLYLLLNNMRAFNPDLWVGLGFFTTKRLPGVGTYRTTDTYNTDFVFKPIVPLTAQTSLIDGNMITAQWASTAPISNVSSAVDALAYVFDNADNPAANLHFRPGSKRVVVVAACSQVGQPGDAEVRLLKANAVPVLGPLGAADYTNELDGSCTLRGGTCDQPQCTLSSTGHPNVLPNAACSCSLDPGGFIQFGNITQFNNGSCTDFGSVVGMESALGGIASKFEIIAFVPNIILGGHPTDFSGGRNSQFFLNLIQQNGGGGFVINTTINLAQYLQNAFPPAPLPPTIVFEPPSLQQEVSATIVSCNATVCIIILTINHTYSVSFVGPIVGEVIINNSSVNVTIEQCLSLSKSDSRSASHHSASNSKSRHSSSHSKSHRSFSASKSHHSGSHSTSHHSASNSKSHHSSSHSKSHHSASHSKSHKSHSHSKSHHSTSNSKSHKSRSHSKSHHSSSHSKSHHSSSHSKSHHSSSHSKSHHSPSNSKSHHSASHSKSHHSESHSKSAHSNSISHQSHHLKSHSKSHKSVSKQSRSHSTSHHSRSHSSSHRSKSHSKSKHSHSHSKSHQSRSHSASRHSRSHSTTHHSHSASASHHSNSISHNSNTASQNSVSHHSRSVSHNSHSESKMHPSHRRGMSGKEGANLFAIIYFPIIFGIPFLICCCCCLIIAYRSRDEDEDERRKRRRRFNRIFN